MQKKYQLLRPSRQREPTLPSKSQKGRAGNLQHFNGLLGILTEKIGHSTMEPYYLYNWCIQDSSVTGCRVKIEVKTETKHR